MQHPAQQSQAEPQAIKVKQLELQTEPEQQRESQQEPPSKQHVPDKIKKGLLNRLKKGAKKMMGHVSKLFCFANQQNNRIPLSPFLVVKR